MVLTKRDLKEVRFALRSLRECRRTPSNGVRNAIVVTAVILGLSVGVADAKSLRTWRGQAVCDELVAGKYTFNIFTDALLITQAGDRVHASAFGVLYEGTTQQLVEGPNDGEAALHACGGVPDHKTIRIQHITTKPQGESKLDGITLLESDFLFPGARAFATCKLTYTRASVNNPNVPSCR